MTENQKRVTTSSLAQRWKKVWPQVPLGLFLFFVGAINVLTRVQSRAFRPVFEILASVTPLSQLGKEVSLGILGSGVQVLLGTGLLLTGIALFWRLRSAWAFSILLLVIAIILDLFNQRDFQGAFLSATAMAALVIWEKRFSRRSLVGGYLMSLIGLLAVLAYGVLGSLLIGGNFHPAIKDVYTALYFTVVTLSTVGSNIYPSTSEGRLFMVSLILGGISIFTTTIVTTLGPLLSNQFRPIRDRKNTKKNSVDRVALVGKGLFVESLSQEFIRLGIDFVQIVTPDEILAGNGHSIVRGEGGDEDIVKQAEISSASAVVIVGENTTDKIAIADSVKRMNPSVRLGIVKSLAETIEQLRPAHADFVLSPETVAARTLANLLIGNSVPKI